MTVAQVPPDPATPRGSLPRSERSAQLACPSMDALALPLMALSSSSSVCARIKSSRVCTHPCCRRPNAQSQIYALMRRLSRSDMHSPTYRLLNRTWHLESCHRQFIPRETFIFEQPRLPRQEGYLQATGRLPDVLCDSRRTILTPCAITYESHGSRANTGGPWMPTSLRRCWEKACREVGIEGISIYEGCKHSFATDAVA